MDLGKIVKEQVDDHALAASFALVGAVAGSLGMAIWAAVEKWSGPAIALAALGVLVAVVVIAVCVAVAHHYGYLQQVWVRKVAQFVASLIGIAFLVWIVGVIGEVKALRAAADKPAERIIERVDPNPGLVIENTKIRGQLTEQNGVLANMKRDLESAQTEVGKLNAQLNDRARRERTIGALSTLAKQLANLRGQCRTTEPMAYVEAAKTLIAPVVSLLITEGFMNDARRLADGVAPAGIPRLRLASCEPFTSNRDVVMRLVVSEFLIDDIVRGLSR